MYRFVRTLAALGFAASTALAGPHALAQELPELNLMAPAGPGGGWDTAARTMQQVLTETGQVPSVQVVNVTGAGGTIGLAQFINQARGSEDDLLVAGITLVGAILSNRAPVDLTQVTPIARLTGDPLVIVVPASSELQTIDDLAAAVEADVATAIWAGGSAGGADHMLAALFAEAAGADPSRVNYVAFSGGGEALAAMLGAQVTAGISGYNEFQSQIESGELRALAISSGERIEGVDVPTLTEAGYEVELLNWRGVFAGPDISEEAKATLGTVIETMVQSPEWIEVSRTRGWSDFYAPADEFESFVASESERVGTVLRSIGLLN